MIGLLLCGCDTGSTSSSDTTTLPVHEMSVSSLSDFLSNCPKYSTVNIQITDKKPDLTVIAQALRNDDTKFLQLDLSKATDLTEIEAETFSDGCSSLVSITIPDSIKSIGDSAFSSCIGLRTVNYTGTIEDWCEIEFGYHFGSHPLYSYYDLGTGYIHNLYIRGQLVTDLVIPDTVTEIKELAF